MGRRLSQAIGTWATMIPHGCRAGGTVGGFSFIQLHTRPDPRAPEVQLTLRAAIVDGQPVIQVPELEAGRENQAEAALPSATGTFVVAPIGAAASAREPTAVCDACGRTGTIGRAVRTGPGGEQIEAHRFCRACRPEQSARYRARWHEEDRLRGDDFFRGRSRAQGPGHGASFVSVTLHGALELVETIERARTSAAAALCLPMES